MSFTDMEVYEFRRMLAAFKEELPPHDLGYWRITSQATAVVVEYEPPPNTGYIEERGERFEIRGHAGCVRCRKRFEIPAIGNFTTYADHIDRTIVEAKRWVESLAQRDGPCWGDVPEPPEDDRFFVTLD